jgi:ribonuclease R
LALLRARPGQIRPAALARELQLKGPRALTLLKQRLAALEAAGHLRANQRGEFSLVIDTAPVTGVVSAHRDGFGFLIPEDGGDDVYLPATEMRQLLDGDRVSVRVFGRGRLGRRAGQVHEILARGRTTLIGRYLREHGSTWVVEPGRGSRRFLVAERDRGGAQPGQLVKLEIVGYPALDRDATGRVVEVLGDPADPRVLTDAALDMWRIPVEWPRAVQLAARRLGGEVVSADKRGREDLRHLPLVTIDGEDARDFDDAVFAEPAHGGFRLIVAIADVSHYVQPGDPIDAEARRRGTSVYFPDRVVPMLPESLSNELCSLKPDVDRLCMACEIQVGADGEVGKSRFFRAVMRSRARLTYTIVDEMHRRVRTHAGSPEIFAAIENLYAVFRLLQKARHRRGALDLDLPEVKVLLGAEGIVTGISARYRNDAHRVIEECMITANVEAARLLERRRVTTLYRVHGGPADQKLEELRILFQTLDVSLPATVESRPVELSRALDRLKDRPDFAQLAGSVLRSMQQAVYQPANTGHYGLALRRYAHFTSPIRRYPDLVVHRGIGHLLDGGRPAAFPLDAEAAAHLGTTTSMQERRADEATRHVVARCKCLFMREHVGAEFDGVITGVTAFGVFVTLGDLQVDGLLHVSSLPGDRYELQPGARALRGTRTRRAFSLGEPLRVSVARVDPDEGRIDLALPAAGRRR